jgi:hypothetical protein
MRSQLTAGSGVYALTEDRQLIGQANEHDDDEHHQDAAEHEHDDERWDEPPAGHDATTETASS